jgi:hypothetical protein
MRRRLRQTAGTSLLRTNSFELLLRAEQIGATTVTVDNGR